MATDPTEIDRLLIASIREALADTPVVAINGARQVGKSTLVRRMLSDQFEYLTLDDPTQRAAAINDPAGFLEGRSLPLVIDEVQRAPDILIAIKASVDRDRRPGRYVLTGSTRLLSTPRISESLAGRIEILELWPFSQGELNGRRDRFVDELFAGRPGRLAVGALSRADYIELVARGGFPEARLRTGRRLAAWFSSYSQTVVARVVEDVAEVERLGDLAQLVRLCAARTGTELNAAAIARDLGVPYRTLSGYLVHLQTVFLIQLIPAWSRNISSKVVHRPKITMVDSGLATHLAGLDATALARSGGPVGPLLESFVAMELRKQLGWSEIDATLFHFRDRDGAEVDLVLEARDGRIAGIEVKAASSVGARDFRGLRLLQARLGDLFTTGVVLYTGREVVPFGSKLFAVPLDALWGGRPRKSPNGDPGGSSLPT
jgi:uncharacterized protein